MSLPKKVTDRFKDTIKKYQSVLQTAKDKDINEADTVLIINDILSDVFGFDKYFELTSEFAIRNQYCDIAIKIDGTVQFIIEVKAIGMDLKENHLKQAVHYGADQGIPWVILTNGIVWEIYLIKIDKKVTEELICSFNLLDINPSAEEDQEKLFILCKEGLGKSAREEFLAKVHSVNRFMIGQIILDNPSLSLIRRELRKLSPGLKVDEKEIEKIIVEEIFKREIYESDDAKKAKTKLKRSAPPKKAKKKEHKAVDTEPDSNKPAEPNIENPLSNPVIDQDTNNNAR